MYLKARNYVGHNVLLKRGKIKIEKAKEKKDLAKYIKKDNKTTPFARLEEYVSDVISNSYLTKEKTENSEFVLNMLQSVDMNDSLID